MEKLYDLVIIGSGPAGLGAAIYARRAMLDAVTIEKGLASGGQILNTEQVDNYPVYGARPLKRYLQKHVETLAAKLILADGVRAGDTILIDVKDGKLSASAVQKNA